MESDPLGYALLLLVLLLVYALLTAAEAAARALNGNRLRRQADLDAVQTDQLLTFVQRITSTPSGLRTGLNFLLLFMGGAAAYQYGIALAGWLQDIAPFLSERAAGVVSTLLIITLETTLVVTLGTLLPRKLATSHAERAARLLRRFALVFHHLFMPLANGTHGLAVGLLKLTRQSTEEEIEQLTEDEIRQLVDAGEEKGAIQETEREMIENVFEFDNLTAADAMTHRTDMHAIWVDDTWQEILHTIETTGLSRFPVYDEDLDNVIGTVSTRDFLLNWQKEKPKPLRDILRGARFVPESVRTDVLFRDMQHNKYHMAIVVDEYGGTSGLITMEDLLEEIVGNIYDEYDPQVQQELIDLGNGVYRVSGGVELETLNDTLDIDLPLDEEFDTIGGMIMSQLGSIPEEGSQPEVEYGGIHFKVLSVADRRVEWVEVALPEEEIETDEV